MINLQKKKQTGFTLLELIVVISLLGLVTSLASDFVINETNQQRFNTTKQRMEQIRYAIIGDSSRSLNGQPTISGFIADTGRVPASIENLISNVAYCSIPSEGNQTDCEALTPAGSWVPSDPDWKGPYLRPTGYKSICAEDDKDKIISKVPVFRDGWANQSNSDCKVQPDKNYGWEFTNGTALSDASNPPSVDLADIKLQSLGLGGKADVFLSLIHI